MFCWSDLLLWYSAVAAREDANEGSDAASPERTRALVLVRCLFCQPEPPPGGYRSLLHPQASS